MSERLREDPELASAYQAAHQAYLDRRAEIGEVEGLQVPEIEGISAGGMPTRVKCLHVLVGHSLAAGPGVNPLGDEALAALAPWGIAGPCVAAGRDPEFDGGTEFDGETEFDGGTQVDGEAEVDGGTEFDGGTQVDGEAEVDGGTEVDGKAEGRA
jgi:hypothetical protein